MSLPAPWCHDLLNGPIKRVSKNMPNSIVRLSESEATRGYAISIALLGNLERDAGGGLESRMWQDI